MTPPIPPSGVQTEMSVTGSFLERTDIFIPWSSVAIRSDQHEGTRKILPRPEHNVPATRYQEWVRIPLNPLPFVFLRRTLGHSTL